MFESGRAEFIVDGMDDQASRPVLDDVCAYTFHERETYQQITTMYIYRDVFSYVYICVHACVRENVHLHVCICTGIYAYT